MAASEPPLAVNIEPGTRLGEYELLRLLTRGGMANVWVARPRGEARLDKLVAVKTVLPHEADNRSFREMFLDEVRLASRIDHPNVVRIMGAGELEHVPYLVMELIDGEALDKLAVATRREGRGFPIGIALRVVIDACRGLHAAHELRDDRGEPLNVVHRDVSPQNILVTTTGVAKVIDFGIAKARDRSARQTTTGTLKGKIHYMPKEQALGKKVDARTDVWALGAVLYYLLAGHPPYHEETQLGTLALAMSGAPIPPLPDTVPVQVREVVMKALEHELPSRYQSAAELAQALEDALRALGVVVGHAEVASFVASTLADRLASRRQLVEKALSSSVERDSARGGTVRMAVRNAAGGLGAGHLRRLAPGDVGRRHGRRGPALPAPKRRHRGDVRRHRRPLRGRRYVRRDLSKLRHDARRPRRAGLERRAPVVERRADRRAAGRDRGATRPTGAGGERVRGERRRYRAAPAGDRPNRRAERPAPAAREGPDRPGEHRARRRRAGAPAEPGHHSDTRAPEARR